MTRVIWVVKCCSCCSSWEASKDSPFEDGDTGELVVIGNDAEQ